VTIDTGVLFAETLQTWRSFEERFGITVTVQDAVGPDGPWTGPDNCCSVAKVAALERALADADGWITGIRRDQTPQRANAKKIDWDAGFGLVKLNPLADWTSDHVWQFIRENKIPYNPLHDQNYPSIGCTYCTRQVMPGEDPRAGRWSGFVKKECGLHAKE